MQAEQRKIMIVGGGLAGLACARHLTEAGETDFRLVSEDIGGRTSSSCERINFGAFYARTDYRHVWPLMRMRRRFNMLDGCLIDESSRRHTVWTAALRHPIAVMRFARHLARFDRHLQQLMRRGETMSLRQAIESDPYIFHLYHQSAADYLTEHGLSQLQNILIAPALRGHVFLDCSEVPAITMLRAWMATRRRAYECSFQAERLTNTFRDQITIDSIVSVNRAEDGWHLRTRTGKHYQCQTLVMATPVDVTKKLVGEPDRHNETHPVHLALVDGRIRAPYGDKTYTILPLSHADVAIVRYDDGTYLFVSNSDQYDLSKYFESWTLVASKHWEAPLFIGSTLVESRRSDDLYLIGDFVLGGMEMAYITGKFAATDISRQQMAETAPRLPSSFPGQPTVSGVSDLT